MGGGKTEAGLLYRGSKRDSRHLAFQRRHFVQEKRATAFQRHSIDTVRLLLPPKQRADHEHLDRWRHPRPRDRSSVYRSKLSEGSAVAQRGSRFFVRTVWRK